MKSINKTYGERVNEWLKEMLYDDGDIRPYDIAETVNIDRPTIRAERWIK